MTRSKRSWKKSDSLEVRFLRCAVKTDSCWDWIGSLNAHGYSQITFKGQHLRGHRVSYEIHRGKIEGGLLVCHRCDNRKCTNPDHLFLGTDQDNASDMISKGRNSFGSRIGISKLKDSDVMALRKMVSSRYFTKEELSLHFGVCGQQIGRILSGQQWKHLNNG